MWNSDPKGKIVTFTHKNWGPAKVLDTELRGRSTVKNLWLYVSWTNERLVPKWVKASNCIVDEELTKKALEQKASKELKKGIEKKIFEIKTGTSSLNWFQKFIVRLQNWWYER